jgi:hypothetical protein
MFDSEYWQSFWEDKHRKENVFLYNLTPFLEEIRILLLTASEMWHPWSPKRKKELQKLSYDFRSRADRLRTLGPSWAAGGDAGYLLSTYMPHRYIRHDREERCECPEAVPYFVSAAIKMLFQLVPLFEKIEERNWQQGHKWVPGAYNFIEDLYESPASGDKPDVPHEAIKCLAIHGTLLECNLLAQAQAEFEDALDRQEEKYSGKKRKRKKVKWTKDDMDRMHKLADDIGCPLDWIMDAESTEYSPWWEKAQRFRDQAKVHQEMFVSQLPISPESQRTVLNAWECGVVSRSFSIDTYLLSETTLADIEKTITALIASFIEVCDTADKEVLRNIMLGKITPKLEYHTA